jgi:DNA-binding winged helix-turn-helix (wHTH) protein
VTYDANNLKIPLDSAHRASGGWIQNSMKSQVREKPSSWSPRAMRLLLCLAARPDHVVEVQELLEEV